MGEADISYSREMGAVVRSNSASPESGSRRLALQGAAQTPFCWDLPKPLLPPLVPLPLPLVPLQSLRVLPPLVPPLLQPLTLLGCLCRFSFCLFLICH